METIKRDECNDLALKYSNPERYVVSNEMTEMGNMESVVVTKRPLLITIIDDETGNRRDVITYDQDGTIRMAAKCGNTVEIPPPDDYVPRDDLYECLAFQSDLLVDYIISLIDELGHWPRVGIYTSGGVEQ